MPIDLKAVAMAVASGGVGIVVATAVATLVVVKEGVVGAWVVRAVVTAVAISVAVNWGGVGSSVGVVGLSWKNLPKTCSLH